MKQNLEDLRKIYPDIFKQECSEYWQAALSALIDISENIDQTFSVTNLNPFNASNFKEFFKYLVTISKFTTLNPSQKTSPQYFEMELNSLAEQIIKIIDTHLPIKNLDQRQIYYSNFISKFNLYAAIQFKNEPTIDPLLVEKKILKNSMKIDAKVETINNEEYYSAAAIGSRNDQQDRHIVANVEHISKDLIGNFFNEILREAGKTLKPYFKSGSTAILAYPSPQTIIASVGDSVALAVIINKATGEVTCEKLNPSHSPWVIMEKHILLYNNESIIEDRVNLAVNLSRCIGAEGIFGDSNNNYYVSSIMNYDYSKYLSNQDNECYLIIATDGLVAEGAISIENIGYKLKDLRANKVNLAEGLAQFVLEKVTNADNITVNVKQITKDTKGALIGVFDGFYDSRVAEELVAYVNHNIKNIDLNKLKKAIPVSYKASNPSIFSGIAANISSSILSFGALKIPRVIGNTTSYFYSWLDPNSHSDFTNSLREDPVTNIDNTEEKEQREQKQIKDNSSETSSISADDIISLFNEEELNNHRNNIEKDEVNKVEQDKVKEEEGLAL
ncbi:MAG: hypothetical protein J0H68_01715 [Sphingobacteriia bacterium]|nr:hypothetical protein [Sphingobacteriia bacterium]